MSKKKLNNKKSRDLSSRYIVKSKIMEKGLHKKYSEISQVLFFDSYGLSNTDLTFLKYTPSEARKLNNLYANLYPYVWKECSRINNASYKRSSRLRDKIIDMLWTSDCVFITFTFTDKVFEKTSEETRRRYVRRFLKGLNAKYVANIDYGSLNGREHYHGVVCLPYIPLNKLETWYQKYGSIKVEKIKKSTKEKINYNTGEIIPVCSEKLAKYISKLTNHAIKETTKQKRIIYSR